jgi:hypothetical protein
VFGPSGRATLAFGPLDVTFEGEGFYKKYVMTATLFAPAQTSFEVFEAISLFLTAGGKT